WCVARTGLPGRIKGSKSNELDGVRSSHCDTLPEFLIPGRRFESRSGVRKYRIESTGLDLSWRRPGSDIQFPCWSSIDLARCPRSIDVGWVLAHAYRVFLYRSPL